MEEELEKGKKRIRSILDRCRESDWVLPATFGTVGAFLIVLSIMKYGPGATHASVNYISSSISLAQRLSLVQFDGRYFHEYAPLYPIMSAPMIFIGVDPMIAGGFVNIIAFGLIVAVSLHMMKKMDLLFPLVVMGGLLVLFSKPIFQVSIMAWDTPLFILFILLSIDWMARFLRKRTRKNLIAVSISTALVLLSNYDGVAVIAAGLLMVLIDNGAAFRRRLMDAVIFIVISASPMAIFVTRNLYRTGTLIGEKNTSAYSVPDNAIQILESIGNWFLPGFIPSVLISGAALVMLIIILFLFIGLMRAPSLPDRVRSNTIVSFTILFFFIIYLIITRSVIGMGILDTKICAPLFLPSLLILFSGADHMIKRGFFHLRDVENESKEYEAPFLRSRKDRMGAVLVLSVIFLLMSVVPVGMYVRTSIEEGAGGYNTDRWRTSDLMEKLSDIELNGRIYSNAPDAIYLIHGMRDIHLSPREHPYSSTERTDDLIDLGELVEAGERVLLIWFYNETKGYLYDLDDIKKSFHTEIILRAYDGEIMELVDISGGVDT